MVGPRLDVRGLVGLQRSQGECTPRIGPRTFCDGGSANGRAWAGGPVEIAKFSFCEARSSGRELVRGSESAGRLGIDE